MNSRAFWAIAVTLATLLVAACGSISEAGKHYNAGLEFQKQGNLREAIVEYNEAVKLDPQLAVAYINRGNAYDNLGQSERAI